MTDHLTLMRWLFSIALVAIAAVVLFARLLPIAVISRPGYDDDAFAAPAMAWLRRFVHPASQRGNWTNWSTPALTFLRYRPDPRSATAIRMARPHWHQQYVGRRVRDAVTHRLIGPED